MWNAPSGLRVAAEGSQGTVGAPPPRLPLPGGPLSGAGAFLGEASGVPAILSAWTATGGRSGPPVGGSGEESPDIAGQEVRLKGRILRGDPAVRIAQQRRDRRGRNLPARVKRRGKSPPPRPARDGGQGKPLPMQDQIGNEVLPAPCRKAQFRVSVALDEWSPGLGGDSPGAQNLAYRPVHTFSSWRGFPCPSCVRPSRVRQGGAPAPAIPSRCDLRQHPERDNASDPEQSLP